MANGVSHAEPVEAVREVVQEAVQEVQPERKPEAPKSHAFKPELPELPTPSANSLPANRKRKTPVDFAPAGPNNVQSPSSPSKNSVKFEDGVAPGEGKGEKTIPVPKNRNAVERTIWTFIMIGGFICKFK